MRQTHNKEVWDVAERYPRTLQEDRDGLLLLARKANESIDRSVESVDETIAYVDRIVQRRAKKRLIGRMGSAGRRRRPPAK